MPPDARETHAYRFVYHRAGAHETWGYGFIRDEEKGCIFINKTPECTDRDFFYSLKDLLSFDDITQPAPSYGLVMPATERFDEWLKDNGVSLTDSKQDSLDN
jgi:hypothetical protein